MNEHARDCVFGSCLHRRSGIAFFRWNIGNGVPGTQQEGVKVLESDGVCVIVIAYITLRLICITEYSALDFPRISNTNEKTRNRTKR